MTRHLRLCVPALCLGLAVFLTAADCVPAQGISDTMDDVVTRLYAEHDGAFLRALDHETVLGLLTPEELAVLTTEYLQFDVNVPATVYLMRHEAQEVLPFWLPESDFEKTDLTVRNEHYTYEVWRMDVPAGRVELGINGFDKHRPHYFVAVQPQDPAHTLELANRYPEEYDVRTAGPGTRTYHDWTELVLTEVPDEIVGAKLLTTVRGRSREAHLVGAFRTTDYPSSPQPDNITLTWADDPATTQAIQWRTDTSVPGGIVRFRPADAPADAPWQSVTADTVRIQDRMLMNDRYVHLHTAKLTALTPATTYHYRVGHDDGGWSDETPFTTGPDGPAPFSFIYFGDTHRRPEWGAALQQVYAAHPEAAYYALAGDLVGTGLDRDDWDQFFHLATGVFDRRPVVPCIGNHDDQDGLGAGMYLAHFALPENGPPETRAQGAYHFEYGDSLFVSLDIGSSTEAQAEWLDEVLGASDATWKFAMFHFPPYAPNRQYPVLREVWGGMFEKHGVDLVLTGHVHYYLRTKPMDGAEPVDDPADGTTYITSIGIPFESDITPPDYTAAHYLSGGPLYQLIRIDGSTLHYTASEADGTQIDAFVIEK